MTKEQAGTMLIVEGKSIFFSEAAIKALHAAENVQWGRDIAANYSVREGLTERDYEELAVALQLKMMENNGVQEWETLSDLGLLTLDEL